MITRFDLVSQQVENCFLLYHRRIFSSLCFINLSPYWLFQLFLCNFSQEEEILDLLEQCETDENITFDVKSGIRAIRKGPKVKNCN